MKVMGLGKNLSGELLFPPVEESAFTAALTAHLENNGGDLRRIADKTQRGVTFRGEVKRRVIDAGDPREAGWTFLVAAQDPRKDQLTDALRSLAGHRGMVGEPLVVDCGPDEDTWGDWLEERYYSLALEGRKVPQYVLFVGSPQHLPFRLQSLLDSVANVGRVDFDDLTDLRTYVDKVIRLETASAPSVERQVVVFGPDGGLEDPTFYSREYMAKPLAQHIEKELQFRATALLGADATKSKLLDALRGARPAVIYCASHGLGLLGQPLEQQRLWNGAICCQSDGPLRPDDLFSATDISADGVFLEGAVFFQFACYGYGTPAESDYAHWLDAVPQKCADVDFVAALPKRLLAHPRGPIAYVGHVDTAFLHGFTDQHEPMLLERWHQRMQPFVFAVEQFLRTQPSGLAMEAMNNRYNISNALLTSAYDRQQRGTLKWTPETSRRFVDQWILRSDAQNYMVLGDPAARLRIPEA